jgi:hypothetical protein
LLAAGLFAYDASMSSRYRMEEGRACIDIRLNTWRQLFDLRDPAPFRERDLDPGAVDHLLTSVREIPIRQPVRINLFILPNTDETLEKSVLEAAIRAHFLHERELAERAIAANFRNGRYLFVLGLVIITVFLTMSKVVASIEAIGFAREVLSEGLVVMGWVAMWRPAEVLLYDWWPLFEQRRWIDKLLQADLDIDIAARTMTPLAPPSTSPVSPSQAS